MASKLELYTYFRSSCSARVRIAAHFKGIELQYNFVHLLKDEHRANEYTAINPGKSVPTLVVRKADGKTFTIRQSVAILEYFEEQYPELPRLMPKGAEERAQVRDLVNIIACDTQSLTNMKMLKKAKTLGIEGADWQHEFMTPGLLAYEEMVKGSAGRFSVGDSVTLADVVLVPQIDGAVRFNIDVEGKMPTVWKVYQEALKEEAFKKGRWNTQPDTPEELRG